MSEIKKSDSSTVENAIGKTLAIAAVTLVGLVVIAIVVSNLPYRIDPNLPIPTLDSYNNYTNEESVTISGETIPGEDVVLYIDEELYKDKVASDPFGYFEFENVPVEDEGEYKFEAAVVRGFLLRKRSEGSNTLSVNVDRTSPSNDIDLNYDEVATTNKVEIYGSAEPNSKVIINSGDEKYEAETGENGDFKFTDIPVQNGENNFDVTIEDMAGNSTNVDKKVQIIADAGDLNGDGAQDDNSNGTLPTELPESAGELQKALEILSGNKIMLSFAIIAILALSVSSILAYKNYKEIA